MDCGEVVKSYCFEEFVVHCVTVFVVVELEVLQCVGGFPDLCVQGVDQLALTVNRGEPVLHLSDEACLLVGVCGGGDVRGVDSRVPHVLFEGVNLSNVGAHNPVEGLGGV